MERHEAVRLVLDNLDDVIGYLEKLKEAIYPVFMQRAFTFYDVGVDIRRTCSEESIQYKVTVFSDGEGRRAGDVEQAVLEAVPDYQGWSSSAKAPVPYPADSVLNLGLLKDLKDAGA